MTPSDPLNEERFSSRFRIDRVYLSGSLPLPDLPDSLEKASDEMRLNSCQTARGRRAYDSSRASAEIPANPGLDQGGPTAERNI
jgi:hypothetical protein